MNAEPPAGARVAFDSTAVPLESEAGRLGDVRLLPWDGETFGFAVADLRLDPAAAGSAGAAALSREIERWARREDVELVGCRVGAGDAASSGVLQAAGFRFVELQLRATRPPVGPAALERPRLTFRRAEDADRDRLRDIALRAFRFGRYHADPEFPDELASRRYRHWIERALDDPSPGTRVGVVGEPGAPAGFVHTELARETGDVRLFASDPGAALLAGPALLLGAVRDLVERGANRVTALISAANVAPLNLYASLGFRFHDPEAVFHWSRPDGVLRRRRENR